MGDSTVGFTIKLEGMKRLEALIKRMDGLDGTEVQVGFFEEDRYGPENGNLPVALVAYFNEYGHSIGVQGVPERPFMHETFESRMNLFHIARSMKAVFVAAIHDGRSTDRLLKNTGDMVKDMIQVSIEDYPGSNAPSTIKRKGFNDPLFLTGKMLNSVKFKLYKGGHNHDA